MTWLYPSEDAQSAGAAVDDIATAVEVLGSDATIASIAELASVHPDTVRSWFRARIDRLLIDHGLSPHAVSTWLQFSELA